MSSFSKWEIIYTSKFPESVKCVSCGNFFMPCNSNCSCGHQNNISGVVDKVRPILLWIDKHNWRESMSFAIPLSSSKLADNDYNEIIYLEDYSFVHKDEKFHRPMRAMIHQATRIDGNVLNSEKVIGRLTNTVKMKRIEDKLFNWIFSGYFEK
jgi:hypothetical protein